MSLNLQAEQALVLLSHKTAGTGVMVTAGSVVVEHSQLVGFLSAPGPEIVNLCAIVGVALTAIGVFAGILFQFDRRRREIRQAQSRDGVANE